MLSEHPDEEADVPMLPSQTTQPFFTKSRVLLSLGMGCVFGLLAVLLVVVAKEASLPLDDVCYIFCGGRILEAVLHANLSRFNESKTFVDCSMLRSPYDIEEAFDQLPDHSSATIEEFVDAHFAPPATELWSTVPVDFDPDPPLLGELVDENLQQFATEVNSLWPLLQKTIKDEVYEHPERYSLLPLKNRIMMVPGGRFREVYYWDTYWIVLGLLASNMTQTARLVVDNLVDLQLRFGHVPNGSRRYYLNRSQPPLLSHMVWAVYEATSDHTVLGDSVPALVQEYEYWMSDESGKRVEIEWTDGSTHTLNRYNVEVDYPRPECYFCDTDLTPGLNETQANEMYSELATGAESGVDFTARFFDSPDDFTTVRYRTWLPVELNVYLHTLESHLADMHQALGDQEQADYFHQKAETRRAAMRAVLYRPQHGHWSDFDFLNGQHSTSVSVTNFSPLWGRAYDQSVDVLQVIAALNSSGLVQPGGVATTLHHHPHEPQQWDWPNAWPPFQHMLVQGLEDTDTPQGRDMALHVAQTWVSATFLGFNSSGYMHEKYDVLQPGEYGSGGEYNPQTGFGWTNGVTLHFLQEYGRELVAPGRWAPEWPVPHEYKHPSVASLYPHQLRRRKAAVYASRRGMEMQ